MSNISCFTFLFISWPWVLSESFAFSLSPLVVSRCPWCLFQTKVYTNAIKQNKISLNLLSQMPDVSVFGSMSSNWKMTAEMFFFIFYFWEQAKLLSVTWTIRFHSCIRQWTLHELRPHSAFPHLPHVGKCFLYFISFRIVFISEKAIYISQEWCCMICSGTMFWMRSYFKYKTGDVLGCERDRDASGEKLHKARPSLLFPIPFHHLLGR